MRRAIITALLMLLALCSQAWAEPPGTYRKTVGGLQALLNANPSAYTVDQLENASTKKLEWVVSPKDNCPIDLRLSIGALSYYLNSADANGTPYATLSDERTIILNKRMSQFVFDDGFNQLTRDLQKEVKVGRITQGEQQQHLGNLTTSYTDVVLPGLSRPNPITIVVDAAIVLMILIMGVMTVKEIKAVKRIRSGQTLEECQTAINVNVTKLIKDGEIRMQAGVQSIVDGFKASTTKSTTELRAEVSRQAQRMDKLEAMLASNEPHSMNGKGVHAIAANATDAATNPADIPEWKAADHKISHNGNGVHAKPIVPATPIPVPKTEDESTPPEAARSVVEAILEPTELMSVLDKKARDEQKIRELHDKIKKGDDGEPTVATKRPKTIPLQEGFPEPKKEMSAN